MNMRTAFRIDIVAAVLAFAALHVSVDAAAQQKNCIELTTVAETAQLYVNEQGRSATKLVPVGKAVPGDEIIWTVTARNVCDQAVGNVVVANPVPEHMTYVPNSALGIGTDVSYSLDGQDFKPLAALTVHASDGSTRAARADDVRYVRWAYANAFAPGATAFVRYRATLD